jgi:hypothetical protein
VASLLNLPPPAGPTPLTVEEISRLADLAGVPDANRHIFSDIIVRDLDDLSVRQRKEGPRSDALKKAVASLRSARQALEDMTHEEKQYFSPIDAPMDDDWYIQLALRIEEFLHHVDGGALTRSGGLLPVCFPYRGTRSKRSPGRPLGTRINPALESIVGILTIAAVYAGGGFSVDEKSGRGTLVDALKVLAPHFPKGAVPKVPPLKTLRRAKNEVMNRIKHLLKIDYTFQKEREELQKARTIEQYEAIEKTHEEARARLGPSDRKRR